MVKSTGENGGVNPVERRLAELGVRRWPLTMIGVLLLVESVGLATVGSLNFTAHVLDAWLPVLRPWGTPVSMAFLALSPVAFVTSAGFLRLWTTAWLTAMLLQGITLAVALVLYFYLPEVPGYLYGGMAYSVVIVFYLNSHGVRTAFRSVGEGRRS